MSERRILKEFDKISKSLLSFFIIICLLLIIIAYFSLIDLYRVAESDDWFFDLVSADIIEGKEPSITVQLASEKRTTFYVIVPLLQQRYDFADELLVSKEIIFPSSFFGREITVLAGNVHNGEEKQLLVELPPQPGVEQPTFIVQ